MKNSYRQPQELDKVQQCVNGVMTVEQLFDMLPNRTPRGIRHKLLQMTPRPVQTYEELLESRKATIMLDKDDPGEDDGWSTSHRINAKVGSVALLRRLKACGIPVHG